MRNLTNIELQAVSGSALRPVPVPMTRPLTILGITFNRRTQLFLAALFGPAKDPTK
jgi:hypothetical protein